MGGCAVPECTNRSEKNVKVYQCPANHKRREIWINYLIKNGFSWKIPNTFFVCAVHFQSYYSLEAEKPKKEDPDVLKSTWTAANKDVSDKLIKKAWLGSAKSASNVENFFITGS
jgi:hypothetical protein